MVNDKFKWLEISSDRTEEAAVALMQRMHYKVQIQNDEDKPYFGYKVDGLGTLLFIEPGYTFSIRPAARK